MELGDTIQHVQNLTGDPNSSEFQQSWSVIEEFRKSDFLGFLEHMVKIFTNTSNNSTLRQLAIILCYQIFPTSYENLNSNIFASLNLTNEIISQVLSASSDCFADENLKIRTGAATLFSRIALIDVLTNDSFDITKTLISGFVSPDSEESFESICIILIDLFTWTSMGNEELDSILEALFGFLSSNEDSVSNSMKNYCLKILRTIINNMGEVLTDEQNLKSLFEALFAMAQNPETKAEAFYCWSEFTVNYYPNLELVAEQLAEASFFELTQDENDSESVINICIFWKSIAECELYKKAELNIIKQIASELLPLLFKISVSIPIDQCDNDEDFEPYIEAASAMQSIVKVAPDESLPVLANYVKEYALSEGEENFRLREGALNCLNFIIQFCDCSSVLIESLDLIALGLNDNSPRVKQTAVYCIHAILNSILTLGDSCPFAELVPQIGQKIVDLSLPVMNLMAEPQIDINLASTAASTTADFIRFPGFPYEGKAIFLLLNSAINKSSRDSLILSQSAFSALQSALSKCPEDLLQHFMKAVLEVLKSAIQAQADFWLINHLFYLLQPIYYRLKGKINQEIVELSWSLFESTFNQYPNEAVTLISLLSNLGRAAGELFLPCIEVTSQFILTGLETYDRDESIPSAALGVSLLSDCFDLSPFAAKFLEALAKALSNEEVPLQSKRRIADAIGCLAKKTPSVFVNDAENVIEPIDNICHHVIGNIIAYAPDDLFDEDFDIDDIISSFLKCLRKILNTLAQAESPLTEKTGEILSDLLEVVGGMKEHGDDLLKSSVKSMGMLIHVFQNDMKETFEYEPGFILILKEAQEAEILPETVANIFQFMSSE